MIRHGWKLTIAFIAAMWMAAGLIWGTAQTHTFPPTGPYTLGGAWFWRRGEEVAMAGCRQGLVTAAAPDSSGDASAVRMWVVSGMTNDPRAWARFWGAGGNDIVEAERFVRGRCR